MKSLLFFLAIPALLAPRAAPLLAQQARASIAVPAVAGLRIRVTGEYARVAESGILPFDRQGLQATATVVAVDAAGKPVSAARLGGASWSSSDENVVSIHGGASGPSVMLVAQEDGRATVTVTAAGRTAAISVVVGKARQEIAAGELAPKFRVARLEVLAERGSAGPSAEATTGGLRIRENGHGALLEARAFAADGTPIPLEHFPAAWATGDEKIVEIYQTDGRQAQTTAHDPGSTTVTASIQGITATVNAEVLAGDVTLGPLEGSTVVARASGSAPAVATTTTASEAAPTTTTASTSAIAPVERTGATTAPTGTRVSVVGAAPAGVAASASGGMSATVRWTPAPGASGHVVAWAASAAGPFANVVTVAGTASSATIARVPPGTVYFTVTATYADRASGVSAPVAVVVPAGRQPTNFRAVSAAGYVRLEWDSIPEAIGYTLTRMSGGVATALDDHFPAQARPLLHDRAFVDATGPGTTVGYVLSAVYRALDGRDYEGDAAAMPRTPATPFPPEYDAGDAIQITGYVNQSNTLWVQYAASATGWVSAIAVEALGPTGWKQINGSSFSWSATDAAHLAVPGKRTGSIWIDPNIPRCDVGHVYRLKVVWSVGGDTAPQQVIAERRTRPYSVTADASSLGCHQSTP